MAQRRALCEVAEFGGVRSRFGGLEGLAKGFLCILPVVVQVSFLFPGYPADIFPAGTDAGECMGIGEQLRVTGPGDYGKFIDQGLLLLQVVIAFGGLLLAFCIAAPVGEVAGVLVAFP